MKVKIKMFDFFHLPDQAQGLPKTRPKVRRKLGFIKLELHNPVHFTIIQKSFKVLFLKKVSMFTFHVIQTAESSGLRCFNQGSISRTSNNHLKSFISVPEHGPSLSQLNLIELTKTSLEHLSSPAKATACPLRNASCIQFRSAQELWISLQIPPYGISANSTRIFFVHDSRQPILQRQPTEVY